MHEWDVAKIHFNLWVSTLQKVASLHHKMSLLMPKSQPLLISIHRKCQIWIDIFIIIHFYFFLFHFFVHIFYLLSLVEVAPSAQSLSSVRAATCLCFSACFHVKVFALDIIDCTARAAPYWLKMMEEELEEGGKKEIFLEFIFATTSPLFFSSHYQDSKVSIGNHKWFHLKSRCSKCSSSVPPERSEGEKNKSGGSPDFLRRGDPVGGRGVGGGGVRKQSLPGELVDIYLVRAAVNAWWQPLPLQLSTGCVNTFCCQFFDETS